MPKSSQVGQTVMRRLILVLMMSALTGCVTVSSGSGPSSPAPSATRANQVPGQGSMRMFRAVQAQVEPVAERMCRNRTQGVDCNFRIVIDDRANQPPNAFQTLDDNGRPILGFTASLIKDVRNADELAFIMGHEAAHHIRGHIPKSQQRAVGGAVLGTVLASVLGGTPETVETAQRIGGTVGARQYSKEFELQADALGAVIAHNSGYDPVRGAEYFNRIPDPGDRFLGTHPPNAERIAIVRRTAAQL